ncbi:MAG TPA: FKBP-type peptidyl-prolyl cis-trans isomerase [Bacteroidales bacterium]|nr:FKBP-type peptidyl-prolyl cis-trans isomerase [Bacteroidales bacterium]
MNAFRNSLFFVISIFFVIACGPGKEERRTTDMQELRKTLEAANRILLEVEKQEIKDFIERHGWNMSETGTGLWYQVYRFGSGRQTSQGDVAVIHYSIHLLTGDLVYSSEGKQPREFRIGRGGVEPGLEEGILLMRQGDKARFIMPSHLAHGLPGDGAKIPARATIIYNVELVELH